MNAESSRSHAIFAIHVYQKLEICGMNDSGGSVGPKLKLKRPPTGSRRVERNSKICLIDLAGSERVNATGATGDRLKEATNINSSLSTLGEVIMKLSEKGKNNSSADCENNNIHIPYRNSVLTWILKDSLGGNSKTAIVATISPSEASYSESISTLRYLERAKFVENNAVVNEKHAQDPYVKHLLHQLSAYKSKLNDALANTRQLERDRDDEVALLTEELNFWKSQAQNTTTNNRTPVKNQSSISADYFDDDVIVLSQISNDELTSGIKKDLMEIMPTNGHINSSSSFRYSRGNSFRSDDGSSQVIDSGEREGQHRFEKCPSKKNILESKDRTKEYFESECYELQDSLARSVAECNNLKQRLSEIDDLHKIEMDILREELHNVTQEKDEVGGAMAETSVAVDQHKKTIGGLQISVERLKMRLNEKDLDIVAEKARAQEEIENCNEALYRLECENETLRNDVKASSESYDQLLQDYNNVAIDIAKVSAEKDGTIERQEREICDIRGELEALNLVLAGKEHIIAMNKEQLIAKDEESCRKFSAHEDELNSMREAMNMHKREIIDRDERINHLEGCLLEMKESIEKSSDNDHDSIQGDGLLQMLEDELKREDEVNGEESEVLLDAYKSQISALESELNERDKQHAERAAALDESMHLLSEDYYAKLATLQTKMDYNRNVKNDGIMSQLEEKVDALSKRVSLAEKARDEAKAKVDAHDEVVQMYVMELEQKDEEISNLQASLQNAENHIAKLFNDWEAAEVGWDENEDKYVDAIHNLTNKVEALEADIAMKNDCLELFESQLTTQEEDLKSATAKHEEDLQSLKVEADVLKIYLSAKEESEELLEAKIAVKEDQLSKLLAEKQLIEEGLTIELESFKLALAAKEEAHQVMLKKLDEALQLVENSTMRSEDMEAMMSESEHLKQEICVRENTINNLQLELDRLNEESESQLELLNEKEDRIRRLTAVDIPRLRRELTAKEQDFEATLKQSSVDISRFEQENAEIRRELESRKELDASVRGKKSKFICF